MPGMLRVGLLPHRAREVRLPDDALSLSISRMKSNCRFSRSSSMMRAPASFLPAVLRVRREDLLRHADHGAAPRQTGAEIFQPPFLDGADLPLPVQTVLIERPAESHPLLIDEDVHLRGAVTVPAPRQISSRIAARAMIFLSFPTARRCGSSPCKSRKYTPPAPQGRR